MNHKELGIESEAKNSKFVIPVSLQLDGLNLQYFEIILFNQKEFIFLNILYLRSTTLGCKDERIKKSEYGVKTKFLSFM